MSIKISLYLYIILVDAQLAVMYLIFTYCTVWYLTVSILVYVKVQCFGPSVSMFIELGTKGKRFWCLLLHLLISVRILLSKVPKVMLIIVMIMDPLRWYGAVISRPHRLLRDTTYVAGPQHGFAGSRALPEDPQASELIINPADYRNS